jgi:hypothetical protein
VRIVIRYELVFQISKQPPEVFKLQLPEGVGRASGHDRFG